MITYRSSARFDKEATLILSSQEQMQARQFSLADKPWREAIEGLSLARQFSGREGEAFPLISAKRICVMAGVGEMSKLSLTALRAIVRKALLSPYLKKARAVEVMIPEPIEASGDAAGHAGKQRDDIVRAVIEGLLIGTYVWGKYRTQEKDDTTLEDKKIFLAVASKGIYKETEAICEGVRLTRDLVNDNADTVTSVYMEKVIRDIVKGKKNISLEVLNKKDLRQKGLGLHLAVNQASSKEPKLVIVRYQGSPGQGDYTALVGKGLTFDTGGLNLKTSGHMETMRQDMSGAAAVIGVLKNTIALGLRTNVLFVCALAENAIGAESYKPGDVLMSYAGKTVEVGNTDAEGRLVLADAMAYVVKNYKPARLIDIATLTGACVVALGHDYTGVVTSEENLFQKLQRAAEETDDRIWRLPNYPEIKEAVKSLVADIKNIGFPKGAAGAITAAEFLRQFTGGTPWAHLDIAGTAFVENKERMYFGHGATGAGVRLLTHFLQQNASS